MLESFFGRYLTLVSRPLTVLSVSVPWGNFQSYSFRPDAENGPFSSKAQGRPSEKAWRAFLEGDTVSYFHAKFVVISWLILLYQLTS